MGIILGIYLGVTCGNKGEAVIAKAACGKCVELRPAGVVTAHTVEIIGIRLKVCDNSAVCAASLFGGGSKTVCGHISVLDLRGLCPLHLLCPRILGMPGQIIVFFIPAHVDYNVFAVPALGGKKGCGRHRRRQKHGKNQHEHRKV